MSEPTHCVYRSGPFDYIMRKDRFGEYQNMPGFGPVHIGFHKIMAPYTKAGEFEAKVVDVMFDLDRTGQTMIEFAYRS